MVNHESGCGSGYLFNVLFLDVVDFHLVIVTAFGIVGGQGTGFFKEAVGKVGAASVFTMTWDPGMPFAWNHQSFPVAKEKVSSSFCRLFLPTYIW